MSAFSCLYFWPLVNPLSTGFVIKPQPWHRTVSTTPMATNLESGIICWRSSNAVPLHFPNSPWMTLCMSDFSKCPLKCQGTAWWTCLAPRTWNLAVAQFLGLGKSEDCYQWSLILEIRNHFRQSSYLSLARDLQNLLIEHESLNISCYIPNFGHNFRYQ